MKRKNKRNGNKNQPMSNKAPTIKTRNSKIKPKEIKKILAIIPINLEI